MNTNDYTDEELELLEVMETQPLISIPNLDQEIAQLKSSVVSKHTKRKSVHLKLLESDLQRLQTQAIKEGIPYQILISSILHRYLNGSL
jgi:predicted DNA binding CopG/RHH family protein